MVGGCLVLPSPFSTNVSKLRFSLLGVKLWGGWSSGMLGCSGTCGGGGMLYPKGSKPVPRVEAGMAKGALILSWNCWFPAVGSLCTDPRERVG